MTDKPGLHPRNKHKAGYDFKSLIQSSPALSNFVSKNKYGNESIDFANPSAVKALNSALLKYYYNVSFWDIPKGYLCPPVPGRADYIHHVAELVDYRKGAEIKMLDIGVGANCIYPLIAHAEYGWTAVGTDVDEVALSNAQTILKKNALESAITLRLQTDKTKIFQNIIGKDDYFQLAISNPPFHSSAEEARAGSEKKNRNLGLRKNSSNFGGQNNELWCEGGEVEFIKKMIEESVQFKSQCQWFSTLISKSTTLPLVYEELKKHRVHTVRTLDMAQGQKKSRIIAWKF